jgi:heat shock protein HslJ
MEPTAAPPSLDLRADGPWVVVAYDAWQQGLAEAGPDLLTVRLLDDGQLGGETGCGRFGGGWWLEGDEVTMGVSPTSNLDCSEAQVAEAVGLTTALTAVSRWRATENGIELVDAAGATRVVLAPFDPGDPVGTWDVIRYRRPNGDLVEPSVERPMVLSLTAGGTVGGSTGCRLLKGEYRRDGAGIELGPLEIEGRPCGDAADRAERHLLRAYGDAVAWRQQGDALTLKDSFDEPIVELVRAADVLPGGEPEA